MQLTKYKLGDLIVQRREKNKNYDAPIRGVSKEGFIRAKQQEADTSIYNVFYKYDFVFNPARMELNSIALNLEYEKALCSSLYEVFYVKDENVVLPEFLNLHIKREEFARHCDYIGLGSAREYCRFANISEFDIELPPIEVQREIVEADRLIKRRIRINEQMIAKLEETAQALYRKMFVDGIDKENLPEGWRMGKIGEIIESYSKSHTFDKKKLIFLNTSDVLEGKILLHDYSEVEKMPGQAKKKIDNGDILFSEIRPANKRFAFVREDHPEDFVVSTKLMVLRTKKNEYSYNNLKVYFYLTQQDVLDDLQKQADGSSGTFPQITFDGNIRERELIIADELTEKKWSDCLSVYYKYRWEKEQENEKLTELQSLLLTKMGQ